jgi:uncharacterized iron-regulated membrane protein
MSTTSRPAQPDPATADATVQGEPQRPLSERPMPRGSRRPAGGWFRAFWRWHFYASFLVIPVLLLLAVTGLIYLFRFQLEPLLHADLMRVSVPADTVQQPYAAQQSAVQEAYPNATVVSMTEPLELGRSTVFAMTMPDGSPRDVYVDPYGAEVLGALNPDNTLSGTAVRLHGELMAGPKGDYLIELGACWAIVMALTGYYLFFKGRAARLRRKAAGAVGFALRSRHALVGSVLGMGLLMLLVTGLPWTGLWGAKVQELATANGSSLWSTDPGAISHPTSRLDESLPHSHAHEVPWGLGGSEVPGADAESAESAANVDTAVTVADREGVRHPMTVALPGDERGVYSVIGYAFDNPSDERTVHVDRFDGEIVATYGYDDYPLLAKVVSQGIGLHEGRSLGLVNFWADALFCVLVVFMCLSGPLMWWRRRPRRGSQSAPRSMGAPRGRMPIKGTPVLAAALIVLGVLLPLFGLSLLVVLVADQLILRRVPRLAAWFDAV